MPQQLLREVQHEITVLAPADDIYRLIAEVENWPRIFPPTVHVEHVERGTTSERIQIWATANDEVKTWTSRRTLDPGGRRVEFRQEVSTPPVAAMGGAWVIEPRSATESTIRLLHDYRAVDDDPENLAWIDRAVDRNSRTELAALKSNVEAVTAGGDLLMSFVDSVRIAGPAKAAYDFVNEADRWAERLPHVARVRLTEETPGLQTLEMDTRTQEGATHTTKSIRVCFPHQKIVYKQITLPALMTLHTGCWTFTDEEDGTSTASSQHTVVLKPEAIAAILGPDAGVPQAREYVRGALGANSRATLGHAREYAESRR
ncbi:aromatase/cyclase [Amycolatopsis pithecellobii]|uniref:Cyclase n=1 Tax=Amycolatopsis pithecellobii TaxID=664692 RepID=A0A6N7YRJ2_9PSEU|nr:aromatase/cyclase [Amycolatopsis pithecellobii]MTD54528.1 cyclase [Amycolatopsis pithecellobii]